MFFRILIRLHKPATHLSHPDRLRHPFRIAQEACCSSKQTSSGIRCNKMPRGVRRSIFSIFFCDRSIQVAAFAAAAAQDPGCIAISELFTAFCHEITFQSILLFCHCISSFLMPFPTYFAVNNYKLLLISCQRLQSLHACKISSHHFFLSLKKQDPFR